MRCPYCGGINSDRTAYCVHCGRDLKPQPPPNQYPTYQPRQGASPPLQERPANIPRTPQQQPQQAPATQRRHAPVSPLQSTQASTQPEVPVIPPPPPEPPVQFPPRSEEQLQALEQGALAYNVVNSAVGDGRKKIVRIVYPQGVAWQQVATLLKAFKEQQEDRFDTIIIQGVLEQDTQVYAFTNGQLVFDRNVHLGSLITHRYQIETGNGFEIDSVRIVLTE
jgi:hypothetical protein